ncbi:hypothetical protein PHET_06291 [Paragonimus heterotremus]|uniref:Uncharacterized protein n=1 Tax=Paragonimus heterotremus TaxID=100268 RepID=A0A8J4WZ40_9TREM|nr:hypothetical protein PHET_06291 [Paragonimus heterotremus]
MQQHEIRTSETMSINPIRRLFESRGHDVTFRTWCSAHCQQEAWQACRRSTEHLRQTYNFDFDLMTDQIQRPPMKENQPTRHCAQAPTTLTWQLSTCTSEPTSPVTDDGLPKWRWETLNLDRAYVPKFYHPRHYHSDSHLAEPSLHNYKVPPTPNKTKRSNRLTHRGDTTQSQCNEVDTPREQETTVATLTSSAKATKEMETTLPKIPTLFRIWCARIRRSSHTECANHQTSAKEPSYPTESRRPKDENLRHQSIERYAKELKTHFNPPVPKNSPVKPTGRSVTKLLNPTTTTDTVIAEVSEPEERREVRTQIGKDKHYICNASPIATPVHRYRQLTLFNCAQWNLQNSSRVTGLS